MQNVVYGKWELYQKEFDGRLGECLYAENWELIEQVYIICGWVTCSTYRLEIFLLRDLISLYAHFSPQEFVLLHRQKKISECI